MKAMAGAWDDDRQAEDPASLSRTRMEESPPAPAAHAASSSRSRRQGPDCRNLGQDSCYRFDPQRGDGGSGNTGTQEPWTQRPQSPSGSEEMMPMQKMMKKGQGDKEDEGGNLQACASWRHRVQEAMQRNKPVFHEDDGNGEKTEKEKKGKGDGKGEGG